MTFRDELLLAYLRRAPWSLAKAAAEARIRLPGTPGRVAFENADGIKFHLDLQERQQREIYLYGYYEANTVRWVRHLLKPRSTFVDGGANLGQYSLLAARLGRDVDVHAFEPLSSTRALLEEHVRLNAARVRVVELALLDCAGEMEILFSTDVTNIGRPSLFHRRPETDRAERIRTIALDEYAERAKLGRVDFLKLDIEGAELPALRGARGLLRAADQMVIVVECNDVTFRSAGYEPEDLFAFLREEGFACWLPRAWPIPMTRVDTRRYRGYDNLFFVKGR
ncbi:MAG: FkbM family methyltransferase [Planctomycetes bacterium]|nr:FkbM family methyltransferase [Planctomycetota bacterium]